MNHVGKVSIIVPVYNAEQYLEQCIESVLSQSYDEFELLLINDGSNDKSAEICENYKLQDRRIKVIHQKNSGVASARNRGLETSTGDFVTFLDADDWWEVNYLSVMVFEMTKSDLVICDMIKCISEGKEIRVGINPNDSDQWCWPILENHSISCWRCMFRLNIIRSNNIKFTHARRTGEDQEFTYRYMLHAKKVTYVPAAIYYYRINPVSIMFTANYNHFSAIDAMLSVEEYAKKNCDKESAVRVSNALKYFKCPYILEFAILTVLTAGEKVSTVCSYIKRNGYYDILNEACKQERHYDSDFMRLWKMSPNICLWYYYLRKSIGRLLRKIKVNRWEK